jgi:hypothetical protein
LGTIVITDLLPVEAPAEVRDGYTLIETWDGTALVNCNLCGCDLGVWTDATGIILPLYVQMLARHLFTAHFINHLHGAARGT